MTRANSPLGRSIGVSGAVRWLIAVVAVIAIGGAFAAGRPALALGGLGFLVAALALSYRSWRARHRADDGP